MKKLILLCLPLITACATTRAPMGPSDPDTHLFYTDVKGPSSVSGDCGGKAIWLHYNLGKFQSGEIAQFEGGCKIRKKPILTFQEDVESGKITFTAESHTKDTVIDFEGVMNGQVLEGYFNDRNKKAPKNIDKKPYLKRKMKITDQWEFTKRLPGNKG